jgi:CheY-like chemotaxis protein
MDGVRLVRERRPGVVLLDLVMPDMDGFAVVEMLRGEPATSDVPIVVLTHKEMTRAERDRLGDRINHLAQKGELDRGELVALVGGLVSA